MSYIDHSAQYVMFKTKTLLDMRAITTFGLNAKPNSKSPIGFFGTGLKMAIAVLMRNGIPLRLFIGKTEYMFDVSDGEFRGVEYGAITMQKRHGLLAAWSRELLPFTTELAKNWTLWQAYRELESNTRDEDGVTTLETGDGTFVNEEGYTTIIVGPSAEFNAVYEERDKIFLPEALKVWDYTDDTIQVFKVPSKHVYYRGIRIMDLDKVSMFTYNILVPVELTEDRTVRYEWAVRSKIQSWLAKQEDRPLINQLLNATDDHYESKLEWDDTFSDKPSAVFQDVLARKVAKAKGKADAIHPRFISYHSFSSPPPIELKEKLSSRLQQWVADNDSKLTQEDVDLLDECIKEMVEASI